MIAAMKDNLDFFLGCLTFVVTFLGGAKIVISWWLAAQKEIANLKRAQLEGAIQNLEKATDRNATAQKELEKIVQQLDKTLAVEAANMKQQNIEINKLVQRVESHIKNSEEQLNTFRHALTNGEVVQVGKSTWMFKGVRKS